MVNIYWTCSGVANMVIIKIVLSGLDQIDNRVPIFQTVNGIEYLLSPETFQISPQVTFPRRSHFPGSNNSREITSPRKSHFLGKSHFWVSHISREDTFPGKTHFLGSHISWKVTFPGKLHFPGSCIS